MKLRRLCLILLAACVCLLPLLSGCSEQALGEIAQILLQEWASQQSQQAQATPKPDLWTAPPEEESTPRPTAKPTAKPTATPAQNDTGDIAVVKGKSYDTPEAVAAYIHQYKELPPNFITKNKAQGLGWDSSKGNLWDVAPGKSIGGDHFGNYEKKLPTAKGRKWYECDVNYSGGYRGAERILYASDGLIYYTDDHYNTFVRFY